METTTVLVPFVEGDVTMPAELWKVILSRHCNLTTTCLVRNVCRSLYAVTIEVLKDFSQQYGAHPDEWKEITIGVDRSVEVFGIKKTQRFLEDLSWDHSDKDLIRAVMYGEDRDYHQVKRMLSTRTGVCNCPGCTPPSRRGQRRRRRKR